MQNPADLPVSDVEKPRTTGREEAQADGESAGGVETGSSHGSPRKASVIIRASVEHVGLVGETELTVNVKWPATTFCVQPQAKQAATGVSSPDPTQVPGNGPQAPVKGTR